MDIHTRRSLEGMFPGGKIDEATERLANRVSERLEATGSRTIRKDVLALIVVMAERNGSNGRGVSSHPIPTQATCEVPQTVSVGDLQPPTEDDRDALDTSVPEGRSALDWATLIKGDKLTLKDGDRLQPVEFFGPWGTGRAKVTDANGKVLVVARIDISLAEEVFA